MAQIAVVGNTDDWSTEETVQAFARKGAEVFLVPPLDWSLNFPGDWALVGGKEPPKVDAWVVRHLGDTRSEGAALMLQILRSFESRAAHVFPSIDSMENAIDRYRRTVLLGRAALPLIETRFAGSIEDATAFVKYVGSAVYKPRHVHGGRGLNLLESQDPALQSSLQRIAESQGLPLYLQQFIPDLGRDLRVVIIGDKILGAYSRIALPGKWRSSPHLGGRHAKCPITPEISNLALKAAQACNIDFCTVELAPTPDGLLVYDVNPFASFVGLKEACGVHAPEVLAEYCLKLLEMSA